jgi:uncharacterized protein
MPDKKQVAMVAGYSPNSTTFTNPIGSLRSRGLVDYPTPGRVRLLQEQDAEMDQEEASRQIKSVLDGAARRIVAVFGDIDGDEGRAQVAELSGYSPISTTFTNPVGRLCALGILEKPQPGRLRMSDWARGVLF